MQMPVLFEASPLGIGISVVICIIAALNFILDFDAIEQSANNFLPKDYEWYFGFAVMLTLVWLYIEILKLLAKLAQSRK